MGFMFRNVLSDSKSGVFISNSGKKTRSNYRPVYTADGVYHLEKLGTINSYDDIQAHAESCDLRLIIERYQMTGDTSLFNKREGFYQDMTQFPTNYADMQNQMIEAENRFLSLPVHIREQFGHSVGQFYAMYGSDEFNTILGINNAHDNHEPDVKDKEDFVDEQKSE